MKPNLDQIAKQVSDLLPVLAVKLIHFVKDLPDPDLSIAQAFLLHHLREHGPSTASAIGSMLDVTSGPVTNLTKRLIARGLVEWKPDASDKRVKWFSLTPAGERLSDELSRYSQSRWRVISEELGVEKAQSAVDLMTDAIAVLNRLK